MPACMTVALRWLGMRFAVPNSNSMRYLAATIAAEQRQRHPGAVVLTVDMLNPGDRLALALRRTGRVQRSGRRSLDPPRQLRDRETQPHPPNSNGVTSQSKPSSSRSVMYLTITGAEMCGMS